MSSYIKVSSLNSFWKVLCATLAYGKIGFYVAVLSEAQRCPGCMGEVQAAL